MGEVVPARTSLTLQPPSPPTVTIITITIEFDIAHWSIDKSMFSGALWCAQEIKYQMQVQS